MLLYLFTFILISNVFTFPFYLFICSFYLKAFMSVIFCIHHMIFTRFGRTKLCLSAAQKKNLLSCEMLNYLIKLLSWISYFRCISWRPRVSFISFWSHWPLNERTKYFDLYVSHIDWIFPNWTLIMLVKHTGNPARPGTPPLPWERAEKTMKKKNKYSVRLFKYF